MRKILQTPAEVPGASMADLKAAYQYYAGRTIAGFANQAIAERRVVDAMMSSADLRGHLGIPKDSKPAPTGMAELVDLAEETGRDSPTALAKEGLPGSTAGVEVDPLCNPHPPGSMAARLWARAEGLPPPVVVKPEPPPKRPIRPRVPPATWVRKAPGTPLAKLHHTSVRAEVFRFIEACGDAGATYAAVMGRFGEPARNCIGKLINSKHIEEFTPTTKERA